MLNFFLNWGQKLLSGFTLKVWTAVATLQKAAFRASTTEEPFAW
ncbi:hypothetical protein [Dendronalium sp. ChiSLP03b]|nr:hypothetical protein [Dendronalium sp. ChiSLP03b]